MRAITKRAVDAFMEGKKFNESNTKVSVFPNVTVMSLFGNEIAWRYNDPEKTLSISDGGYEMSNTTKERLNALPNVSIKVKGGKTYLNGKEWDGSRIDVSQD